MSYYFLNHDLGVRGGCQKSSRGIEESTLKIDATTAARKQGLRPGPLRQRSSKDGL